MYSVKEKCGFVLVFIRLIFADFSFFNSDILHFQPGSTVVMLVPILQIPPDVGHFAFSSQMTYTAFIVALLYSVLYNIIFQSCESFEPLSSTVWGDRHMHSRTFLYEIRF